MNLNGYYFEEIKCPFNIVKIAQYVIIDGVKINCDTHKRNLTKSFRKDCEQYV